MTDVNEDNTNDERTQRTEDEASRYHRSHRSPTIVSSGSSLDTLLMDFPNADFLEGMSVALDDSEIGDSNRGEFAIAETSQVVMPSNAVSSGPLHGQQQSQINASALPVQRLESSDHRVPSTSASVIAASSNVPEFLYQLTKMLAQDNREVIEWSNGRIEVHNPHKLEREVLNKYFRHSKFSSFQRQLNYFGFRKLAGKGKMAPCSYVNDAAGDDIASLLHVKRKGTVMNPRESTLANKKKKEATTKSPEGAKVRPRRDISEKANVQLSAKPSVGKLKPTSGAKYAATVNVSSLPHQALARRAVGRGVRHGFAAPQPATFSSPANEPISRSTRADTSTLLEPSTSDGLSQLAINYRNVLNEGKSSANQSPNSTDPTPLSEMQSRNYDSVGLFGGFLSRNSSLVDLAMIAPVDEDSQGLSDYLTEGFGFVDFPNPEVHPANLGSASGDKM